MRKSVILVAGLVATLVIGVASRTEASSPPVPPEDEIVASFEAWAETQGTPVDQPACVVSVTSDGTPMIVCYGLTGDVNTTGYDGVIVVFAVTVEGALEFRPFPLEGAGSSTPASTTVITTVVTSTLAASTGDLGTSFGDGTWLVGTDIAPGTYRTEVPEGDPFCVWKRLSGFSGEYDDTITGDIVDVAGQTFVEIAPTDVAFTSEQCGTWELQSS
jgi:hypothetical protein